MGSSKQITTKQTSSPSETRFIHFAKPRDHAIPLFNNTKIIPINFLYYQLLAETMSDVRNNLLPTNIQEFRPLSRVHSYGTRSSTSQSFYIKKLNLEIQRLFLETWCQIVEWDTDQVAHTFKTQIEI